jgi:hypothetical protein
LCLFGLIAGCAAPDIGAGAADFDAAAGATRAELVDPAQVIAQARWTAPEADLVAELTTAPSECVRAAADPETHSSQEIGGAAFRSPTLLGGQAARAGLSCASCHRNGRGNEAFFFFGVSGAPGTADVTNSFFSSHRGDGEDNPIPIPDLAGPPERLKVDRSPASDELETFIRGLIVEEFDGPEPPPAVLDGLAAYVRALDPGACPAEPREPVGVASHIADADRAATAARAALQAGDEPTALVMLGAARTALGRIHERFSTGGLDAERAGVRAVDAALGEAQAIIRDGPGDATMRLIVWRVSMNALGEDLIAAEPRSLYAPDQLARAAAAADLRRSAEPGSADEDASAAGPG